MSCNNPLHAFDTGFLTENGKPLYKICGKDIEWIYKPKYEDYPLSQQKDKVWHDWIIRDYIEIPCGKCIGCRLKYSKEWANRCMLEAKMYESNVMINVTYRDEDLPFNKETGEVVLDPEDLQNFLKRLRTTWERKYGESGIRFFACGEYGDKKGRPHYHVLAFNLKIHDLEYLKTTKNGDKLYYSPTMEKVWGHGNVWIGEVNWNTCAYVARYIMKKQKGKGVKEQLKELGSVPEFTRMSLKPGIGEPFFQTHKDEIYKYDEISIQKRSKKKDMQYVTEKIRPSRYYDKLYDLENHEFMELLKKKRKASAKAQTELEMSRTTLDRNEYLEMKENRLKNSIKALKRNLEE